MDSSSSGSLQSSSGGGGGGGIGTGGGGSHEEEYTSGGTANHEILSPFLPLINTSSTQYHHYPFSNSLDHHHAFSLNPNPSLPRSSLDSPWAVPPSSAQFVPPSCTNNDTTQLLNPVTSASMMHLPVQSENNRPNMATTSGGAPAAQRGAKKRSRASRRPPTTVLTTDTSNFRAMVQEFTGFPAAPFVPSSPFVRPRLGSGLGGLFQTGGSNTGLNSPYLLRPFPQKLQTNNPSITPSNLTSSTIVDAIASIARSSNLANLNSMFGTSNANANATSTSSSGSNTANFVNASSSNPTAAAAATNNNSSTDPISSFASLHSNSKYNFGAQAAGDLDGLVGSNGGSNVNPMRLACDIGYERDKSSRFVNSEFDTAQAMEKGVFGFLNYADLKDKR